MDVHSQLQVAAELSKLTGASKTLQRLTDSQIFRRFEELIEQAYKSAAVPAPEFKEHLKTILNSLVDQVHINIQKPKVEEKRPKSSLAKMQRTAPIGNSDHSAKKANDLVPTLSISNVSHSTPGFMSARSAKSIKSSRGSLSSLSEFGHVTSPTTKFSKGERKLGQVKENSPGPGAYRPSSALTVRKPKGVTLDVGGKRVEITRRVDSPGPGTYQPMHYALSKRR
jgi:hypothetical protein